MKLRTAFLAVVVVAIAVLAAMANGLLPAPWDAKDDDSPLNDPNLSSYLSNQVQAYSAGMLEYSDVSQMSDEDVVANGYSTTPPAGYKFTYQKHTVQNATPDVLAMGVMDSVWYPGALVKLTNDSGNTIPLTFQASRAPYTISVNLEGMGQSSISATISNPSPSAAREAVASIMNTVLNSEREIPISYTCTIAEASSSEALYVELGTNASVFGLKLNAGVDFSKSSDKTVVALVFKQVYFTVSMDPPTMASSVFSHDASADQIMSQLSGSQTLGYVDVDYGKVVVVQVETTKTAEEVKGSFGMSYKDIAGIEASLKGLVSGSDTSLSYMVYGGSSNSLGLMGTKSVSDIVSILADQTYTAKPIQYKFRYLDGTPADYYTCGDYVTRTIIPDTADHFGDAFDGGDGTSESPYLISTRAQLELISEHPELCYRLTSDIDLSKRSWTPIGDSGSGAYARFTGELDGGGHTLRGMSVDSNAHVDADQAHAGFFASIDNGIVSDIRFVDVTMSPIKAKSGVLRVGTVAGTIIGGTISGVYVQGTMTCSEGWEANVHAGGIVGATDSFGTPHKVSIKNCVSDVDIIVYGNDAYVGGIVGYANGTNTVVSYCFNQGDVSAHAYGGAFDYKSARAGGIIGFIITTCSMDHVFNAGRIDTDKAWGYMDSGGIIGTDDADNASIDTAIFLKGMLYEGNGKQSDVFCDGGRDRVKATDVSCIDASALNASTFDSWDLESHGLMFDGGAVCFIN